ncbi:hypothetical protein [Saccharopolyspora hattusasensis]|uniref:hypothetical protein n=1 Tax=Saccharopolyspora hattusasensis TaxID=1128679 RepID=UPI003D98267A
MAKHREDGRRWTRLLTTEPAAVAELARLAVAALATTGVIQLDDPYTDAAALAASAAASLGLTWWTRRRVTPAARPRDADGNTLGAVPPQTQLY